MAREIPRGPWKWGRSANGFEYSSTHAKHKDAQAAVRRVNKTKYKTAILKNRRDKTWTVYVKKKG